MKNSSQTSWVSFFTFTSYPEFIFLYVKFQVNHSPFIKYFSEYTWLSISTRKLVAGTKPLFVTKPSWTKLLIWINFIDSYITFPSFACKVLPTSSSSSSKNTSSRSPSSKFGVDILRRKVLPPAGRPPAGPPPRLTLALAVLRCLVVAAMAGGSPSSLQLIPLPFQEKV